MTIIPVIDLLRGQVVRAVRGNRQAYQPVVSPLCGSSDPLTVARILCQHCAATQLYVADLDALQGGVSQIATLRALLQANPQIELWLDAGFADASAAAAVVSALAPHGGRVVPVFGSESLGSPAALADCFSAVASGAASGESSAESSASPAHEAALSLDRRDGQRLDAAGCWDAVALWPHKVIVMTLERVGADAGPDLDTLAEVRRKAPGAMLIGAGGIRHSADLATAVAAGADAWLVASALHDLRLPPVVQAAR